MFTFKLTRCSWIVTKCLTNLNMFLFYIIERTSVTSLAKRLKKNVTPAVGISTRKSPEIKNPKLLVSFEREVLLVPNKE